MLSEADLIAKRAAFRWLTQQHPQWTPQDLADALDMSRSWVSKWLRRLHQADPADVLALHSRSRARHTPPVSIASAPTVGEPHSGDPRRTPRELATRSRTRSHPVLSPRRSYPSASRCALATFADHYLEDLTPGGLHRTGPPAQTQAAFRCANQEKKCSSTSKMKASCLLIQKGSGSTLLRLLTLSRLSPRFGYTARSAAISMPKPSSKLSRSFSGSQAYPTCSRSLMTPAWLAAPPDGISPPRWCASSGVWE